MFTRILVPLDGSERAERAIPVAARIARTSSASILLVRVVEVPIVHPVPFAEPPLSDEQEAMEQATDYLKQVMQSDDLKGVEGEISVVFGSAAATVLKIAETYHADLIVMCSHGYTGLKRWMLGTPLSLRIELGALSGGTRLSHVFAASAGGSLDFRR